MKEYVKTVILILLIIFAIAFIVWTHAENQANFVDAF
jgi:hypothetical protein